MQVFWTPAVNGSENFGGKNFGGNRARNSQQKSNAALS